MVWALISLGCGRSLSHRVGVGDGGFHGPSLRLLAPGHVLGYGLFFLGEGGQAWRRGGVQLMILRGKKIKNEKKPPPLRLTAFGPWLHGP